MKKKREHKLLNEFRAFISRGNVIDLAVGVIIGGAFTAIVTALTSNILTPLINWLISAIAGTGSLENARTILGTAVYDTTGAIDWSKTNYIDWGALISAVINFFLIAIILFAIVKTINTANAKVEKLKAEKLEKYYEEHPEERPVVEEAKPEVTELDVLKDIKALLTEKEAKKK